MSLLVHLPLNGNLENKGLLGNLTPTNTPAYVNNGKIGKALSNGGCKMTTELTALVLNNNEVSFAFWIYVNAEEGSTNGSGIIFGNSGIPGPNNRKFSIYTHPDCNSLHLSWMNDGSSTFITTIYSNIIPSYKWTHVTVTYKNPTVTVYINGQYYTKTTGVSNSASFAYETPIVRASQYRYFNDFRIYNHCLSPKEVKEISKGLILHYPLNELPIRENLLTGNFSVYKTSTTVTTNGSLNSIPAATILANKGKVLTLSADVYSVGTSANTNSSSNRFGIHGVINYTKTGASSATLDYPLQLFTPGYNGRVSQSWTIPSNIETVNTALSWSNQASTTSGYYARPAEEGVTWYFRNIKLECGSLPTDFVENTLGNNIVYDCSGYCNNGISSGILNMNNNTPRNNCSLVFDSSSVISSTSMYSTGTDINSLSVSVWFKTNTMNGAAPNFWSLGLNSFIRMRIAGASSVWWYGLIGSTNVGILYNTGKTITDNTWHHIVYTFNNGISKVYLDGTCIGSTDSSNTGTALKMNSTDWRLSAYSGTSEKFVGQLSDFRIYCTALSVDDVKELYNTSAFITNNGTTECYEFDETGSNPIVNKTGIIKVGNLYEDGVGEDTKMRLDTEQTKFGSDFITSKQFNEI